MQLSFPEPHPQRFYQGRTGICRLFEGCEVAVVFLELRVMCNEALFKLGMGFCVVGVTSYTLSPLQHGSVERSTESVERSQWMSDVAHPPVAGDAILGLCSLLCSLLFFLGYPPGYLLRYANAVVDFRRRTTPGYGRSKPQSLFDANHQPPSIGLLPAGCRTGQEG